MAHVRIFRFALIGALTIGALAVGALMGLPSQTLQAADSPPGIVPIDLTETPEQSGQFSPSKREGDFDGSYLSKRLFSSAENPKNRVGIWESGPGVLVIESYRINEYVLLLSGTLVTIDAGGVRRTFGEGETFVIPKGWKGRWEMKTRIRKQYVTF